jgi:hypothetical protein
VAAKVLRDAGFNVTTTVVDVASRASAHSLVEAATRLGEVFGVIHAAGVSPSQASPETILKVDLYGTALVLEEFGNVIAHGGSGGVIASQSRHRLGGRQVVRTVSRREGRRERLRTAVRYSPACRSIGKDARHCGCGGCV